MTFLLLTNLHSLLNTPGHLCGKQVPVGSRGFALKSSKIGPPPPPGLRRRHPRSKNCVNAKKAEINARKLRYELQKEANETAAELLDQIRQLDRQLALVNECGLVARQSTQDSAQKVMRVLFNHIEHWINPTRPPAQAQATKNDLLLTFAEDLKSPDYTSLDQLIEQWQLLSEYHADIRCQSTSIEVYPVMEQDDRDERLVNVVKTYGTTTMPISRTTIERVFPHILSDEPLVQWLIGKTYSFSFNLLAYVDASNDRVFQIESKVDLTSALLDLLQDPFATIKMVGFTTMTKHGNLLVIDDVQKDQNAIENGFL